MSNKLLYKNTAEEKLLILEKNKCSKVDNKKETILQNPIDQTAYYYTNINGYAFRTEKHDFMTAKASKWNI